MTLTYCSILQLVSNHETAWCQEQGLDPEEPSNLSKAWQEPEVVINLARELSIEAQTLAMDELRRSPFSVSAAKSGFSHLGGKLDDITTVVAAVGPEQAS